MTSSSPIALNTSHMRTPGCGVVGMMYDWLFQPDKFGRLFAFSTKNRV